MQAKPIPGQAAEPPAPLESLCALVVRLYDKAIGDLDGAAAAAEQGDIVARFQATAAAAEIIVQLQLALDHDIGGQIADSLDRLYGFILTQLPLVNLDNDATLARSLGDLLRPLRQSWVELDQQFGCKHADVAVTPAGKAAELAAAI